MIKEFSISKALFDHLKAIPELPAIAADNAAFKPEIGKPYLREQDYAGENQAPTLNPEGFQRVDGIYRVGVFVPKESGRFVALTLVDKIATAFNRGLVLDFDGQKVRIEKHVRETGFTDGEWYQTGIKIYYTVVN